MFESASVAGKAINITCGLNSAFVTYCLTLYSISQRKVQKSNFAKTSKIVSTLILKYDNL